LRGLQLRKSELLRTGKVNDSITCFCASTARNHSTPNKMAVPRVLEMRLGDGAFGIEERRDWTDAAGMGLAEIWFA
jgi:hypothetical protein